MSKETREKMDVLYTCPKAGIDVHLKVDCETTKGFFGKKFISQAVRRCDLQAQGGCTIRLEPAINSKCPAVVKAQKCALK